MQMKKSRDCLQRRMELSFLDEVHNLSAENQEKLFLFIDSQKYRMLGDSKKLADSKGTVIVCNNRRYSQYIACNIQKKDSV